jgi:uncharacterized protein (DUF58 family)
VTRRLDGLLQGDYQGLLPGPGSEAGEARPYQPGDDVRRIDWNVTARTAEPHVRMQIAERELETWVLADLSASLDFGTASCEKRDLAVAAVAAVDHLMALLHRVAAAPRGDGGGTTDLGAALESCGRLARRRGMVVVVSDFLGTTGWERPLRALSSRHDVLAVEVLDPRELELPDVGVLALVDPETGQRLEVQTGDRKLRSRYFEAAAEQRRATGAAIRTAGADHLVLRTDRDWLSDMVAFVGRRRRRRTAAVPPVRVGR